MNHSTRRRHNIAAAFVAVIFMAPLFWMLLDREPPYVEHIGKVIPPEVQAGDQITVEWQMKINRVCPGYIAREVVDSQNVLWNYDVQPSVRREQQFDVSGIPRLTKLRRSFVIPEQAAPGPARYRSLACYVCNPIQQLWPICTRTPDVEFSILPKEELSGKLKRKSKAWQFAHSCFPTGALWHDDLFFVSSFDPVAAIIADMSLRVRRKGFPRAGDRGDDDPIARPSLTPNAGSWLQRRKLG
jgi:hypothetical protein